MKPRIVIVGASAHGRVIHDALRRAGECECAGFLDDFPEGKSGVSGTGVVGRIDDIGNLRRTLELDGCVVAIGSNHLREQVVRRISSSAPNLPFWPVIHPAAIVLTDHEIGPGSVILAGAVVGAGARIGSHCIINTLASLDHDGLLDDFASLGPGAHTGGNVKIHRGAAIGLGARVIHNVAIGAHAVIGAGATVLKDIPEYHVAFGTPARLVRTRVASDPYL